MMETMKRTGTKDKVSYSAMDAGISDERTVKKPKPMIRYAGNFQKQVIRQKRLESWKRIFNPESRILEEYRGKRRKKNG